MRTSVGLPQRREGSLLRKESREHGVPRVRLKGSAIDTQVKPQPSLVPPAKPEWIGHEGKYTLGSFDARLSRRSADLMRSPIRRADLICPHTVTALIECLSWGTKIYILAIFSTLEVVTSGTRIAIPSIDPDARRRTSINILREKDPIPC